MPELRRDPIVGHWTIISTERSRRPVDYKIPDHVEDISACPFCEGREAQTTPEVFAIRYPDSQPNGPGWEIRVIPSKAPILSHDQSEAVQSMHGIYPVMNGVGRHEIIIESPKHKHDLDELSLQEVERVISVYVARLRELEKDERFEYTLLFKNHGHVSGVPQNIVRHSRSQIISMPIMPKRVKEELLACENYFYRRERCVFCDILKQEAKEGTRKIDENESFFCFCPFASRSPFEMWIMPKTHSSDFGHMRDEEKFRLAEILKGSLVRLRNLLDDPPFNFILHTAPFRHASRELRRQMLPSYHWYLQIAPRMTTSAGFEWGTGIHINPTPPEDAARLLRETQVVLDGGDHATAS